MSDILKKLRAMSAENTQQAGSGDNYAQKEEQKRLAGIGQVAMEAKGVQNTAYPATEQQKQSVSERLKNDRAGLYRDLRTFGLDDSDFAAIDAKYGQGGDLSGAPAKINSFVQGAAFNMLDNLPGMSPEDAAAIRGNAENNPGSNFAGEMTRNVALSAAAPNTIVHQGLVAGASNTLNKMGQQNGVRPMDDMAYFAQNAALGGAGQALLGNLPQAALKAAQAGDMKSLLSFKSLLSPDDWKMLSDFGQARAASGHANTKDWMFQGTSPDTQAQIMGQSMSPQGADDAVSGMRWNLSDEAAARSYDQLEPGIIPNESADLAKMVQSRVEAGEGINAYKDQTIPIEDAIAEIGDSYSRLSSMPGNEARVAAARQELRAVMKRLVQSYKRGEQEVNLAFLHDKYLGFKNQARSKFEGKSSLNAAKYDAAADVMGGAMESASPELGALNKEYEVANVSSDLAANRLGAGAAQDSRAVSNTLQGAAARGLFSHAAAAKQRVMAKANNSAAARIYNFLAKQADSDAATGVATTWKKANWQRMLEKLAGTPDESVAIYALKSTDPEFAKMAAEAEQEPQDE